MKILFLCGGNLGRSQVAQAFFERDSRHDSVSAGTEVDRFIEIEQAPGRKVRDAPSQRPATYMLEHGIDISDNVRTQLEPEMLDEFDKVVLILEEHRWPDYLRENEKVVFWDLPDTREMGGDSMRVTFDEVKRRVDELIDEIG